MSIDEGPEETVDLFADSTIYNALVFESQPLCPGQHTLTVRATGQQNAKSEHHFISIDRLEVLP